jgi:hypothetical protein
MKNLAKKPQILDLTSLLDKVREVDPVRFIEKYRTIKGKEFRIVGQGRDYLVDFYRYMCVGALKDKKPTVVVKGRQVEMTEAALNISLYYLCNYKFFTALHSFPRDSQVSRFSTQRLQGALRDSATDGEGNPMLMGFLADHKNARNTVSGVEFKHSSYYYMYSAWGEADALRGISADLLCRDEFQDWSGSAIDSTDACLSASEYKIEFSFGTPKGTGTPFEDLWENSDKRYFHTRCTGCNHLFVITMDNFIYGMTVQCPRCHKDQDKRISNMNGVWVPQKESRSCMRTGFHISQLMSPMISKEEIIRKYSEMSPMKFKNEVLGEFFSGSTNPLEPQKVIATCCEPYKDEDFVHQIVAPKQTFMGIDWGGRTDLNDKGAYTVVTILSKDRDKYKVEFAKRITYNDYLKQVAYIKELIRMYNCVQVVADIGAGAIQCQMLQTEFKDTVKSCYYSANLKNKYIYNPESWMISVDRDAWLEELIDIIVRANIMIPWRNNKDKQWFIDQICNTEIGISEKTGNVRRKYQKAEKKNPNDALHSLNYAYIASVTQLGENAMGSPTAAQFGQSMPSTIGARFSGGNKLMNKMGVNKGMQRLQTRYNPMPNISRDTRGR